MYTYSIYALCLKNSLLKWRAWLACFTEFNLVRVNVMKVLITDGFHWSDDVINCKSLFKNDEHSDPPLRQQLDSNFLEFNGESFQQKNVFFMPPILSKTRFAHPLLTGQSNPKFNKKLIDQINLLRQTQEVSEEVVRERFGEAGGYLVSLDSAGFGWLTLRMAEVFFWFAWIEIHQGTYSWMM